MQIYIADLQAYNSGYLKGEWIPLPTEEDDIQGAILRQSQNGQNDFVRCSKLLNLRMYKHGTN